MCVLWQALGCLVDVPSVSVCQLLDQLINLFCFYNGSISLSYQVIHLVEECALFRACNQPNNKKLQQQDLVFMGVGGSTSGGVATSL